MSQYSWVDCPPTVKNQVKRLTNYVKHIMKDNLIEVYLHGSLAMGCFNPDLSDIDIIVVTQEHISKEQRYTLLQEILRLSCSPCQIELSILCLKDIARYEYPLKYDFHYSEMWRETYQNLLLDRKLDELNKMKGSDPDLTAHIVIILDRGICLYGHQAKDVFPSIPKEHYLKSILSDIDYIDKMLVMNLIYGVLNLCRIYWYILEGKVSSKDEAGQWGIGILPEKYAQVVGKALEIYRGVSIGNRFDSSLLEEFTRYIKSEITNVKFKINLG